jgi:peptidoglycan hydrolase-like protein with peptidoglycan-binding domain
MFRAGGEPRGIPALTAGLETYLADVSEWNPQVADAAYLAWSRAIAIRALYGTAHEDAAWYGGARRASLHAGGVRFLGIYAYLTQGEDAAAQAEAFVRLVGPLRPGEVPVCDLEEGDGDQSGRWEAWAAVIQDAYRVSPWLYSGLDFAATHGLRPQWIAAYQGAEPAAPHLLWQFTSAYPVPGVGLADCSVYHGTTSQLVALIAQPPPPVPAWEVTMMGKLPVLSEGSDDARLPHWYVRRVQAILNDVFGASPRLAVSGVYDAPTRDAVVAVQRSKGITADGVCGPATWSVLISGTAP